MSTGKVYIIGIAPEGAVSLSPETSRLVQQADIVCGGARLLDMFPSLPGERIIIGNNLKETADLIRENFKHRRIVVLASGDPSFYGIARYLTGKLGRDSCEIIPNVSAMQLAFARIKESWDDAVLASVHSRAIEDIVPLVRSNAKVGLFTDDKHSPGEIARVLRQHGIDNRRVYVCQDLGSQQEKIIATDLDGLKDMKFSPLNVMILIQDDLPETASQPRLGIDDEAFHRHREGLITKLEIRAVSLARLCLREDSVVWDIGAGSGAVSIEAALLAGRGSVFAVEKDDKAIAAIKENVRKFGTGNVTIVKTQAPEGLEKLPDPTAVFVGGSGGRLAEILKAICGRLQPGGRIVINAATLETLHAAVEGLKANGFTAGVTLVNIARSQDIANLTRLQPLNPVFVIAGRREREPQS